MTRDEKNATPEFYARLSRRHTLSNAYADSQALLLAQATRPHAEPTSDVEVTRNAKQEIQFKVAVTMHDPDAALAKAKAMVADLEQTYPASNGAAS